MLKKSGIGIIVGVLLLSGGGFAYSATGSQGSQTGSFQFLPSLGLSQQRNGNIFSQPTAVRSSITQYKPELRLVGQVEDNVYAFTYQGEFGVYDTSPEDDYDDQALRVDLSFGSARNDLDIKAGFARLHENRGEGTSEGPLIFLRTKPDEYDLKEFEGVYNFGADGTRMGFQVTAGRTDIEFESLPAATVDRSREESTFSGRLYGRLAPKTRFFVEGLRKNLVYDFGVIAGAPLDSKEETISLGAEWEISGVTKGSFKAGETRKDFDDPLRGEFTVNTWEGKISWSPLTYSVLTLTTSRMPGETNGSGNFIVERDNVLEWKHGWTDSMSTTLTVTVGEDRFANSSRSDDREEARARFDYTFTHKFDVGAGYFRLERDSTVAAFDFVREVFFVDLVYHF